MDRWGIGIGFGFFSDGSGDGISNEGDAENGGGDN